MTKVHWSTCICALLLSSFSASASTTYEIFGSFASGGDFSNGTFSGFFTIPGALPITPPNVSTSYQLFTNFNVLVQSSTTTLDITPANGFTGIVSAGYETVTGGDYIEFYNSSIGDYFTLYFADGFNGTAPVIPKTSQNYLSDVEIGGATFTNVKAGISDLPEPSTAIAVFSGIVGLALLRCKQASGAI